MGQRCNSYCITNPQAQSYSGSATKPRAWARSYTISWPLSLHGLPGQGEYDHADRGLIPIISSSHVCTVAKAEPVDRHVTLVCDTPHSHDRIINFIHFTHYLHLYYHPFVSYIALFIRAEPRQPFHSFIIITFFFCFTFCCYGFVVVCLCLFVCLFVCLHCWVSLRSATATVIAITGILLRMLC